MSILLLQYLIVFFAACGFGISLYIFIAVESKKTLVCPIGTECNDVVQSKYAKTFGISNAIAGVFYYGFTAVSYVAFSLQPDLLAVPYWLSVASLATVVALVFSIYLLFIQGAVLKRWCFWCVTSAICTIAIFALIALIRFS